MPNFLNSIEYKACKPSFNELVSKNVIKTALITGAGRRVGAKIAQSLHRSGFNIILHYRHSKEDAQKLVNTFNQSRPDSAHIIAADLCRVQEVRLLANNAYEKWGRIDVLVNNAAVFYPTDIVDFTEEHWNELMDVNLKAPLFLVQSLADALREHNGCIINMLDIHGERSLKGHPIYCASKAGLAMLTRSLARELAPSVRCNGVAPGAVLWHSSSGENEQREIISRTALKRAGSPDDIAKAVLFLVQNADYITGQVITVDGGRTLSN